MNDNFSKLILTNDNLSIVEQMAENIPGGFFIYKDTEKAEIIYVNKAVLELYGCDNLEEFKLVYNNEKYAGTRNYIKIILEFNIIPKSASLSSLQISNILLIITESCIRYLAKKFNSERLFKLSLLLY